MHTPPFSCVRSIAGMALNLPQCGDRRQVALFDGAAGRRRRIQADAHDFRHSRDRFLLLRIVYTDDFLQMRAARACGIIRLRRAQRALQNQEKEARKSDLMYRYTHLVTRAVAKNSEGGAKR